MRDGFEERSRWSGPDGAGREGLFGPGWRRLFAGGWSEKRLELDCAGEDSPTGKGCHGCFDALRRERLGQEVDEEREEGEKGMDVKKRDVRRSRTSCEVKWRWLGSWEGGIPDGVSASLLAAAPRCCAVRVRQQGVRARE
jgi:hypothetical protein